MVEQIDLFESEPPPDLYPAAFLDAPTAAPKLITIRIRGLKAFDDVEVELPRLTVLTGPNNSGKSTILQAIALGFECLRRCVDTERWRLVESGRAVTEFEFLPVNEPRDLWYQRVWKPSRDEERAVEIDLLFEGDLQLFFRIRFLFGLLNIKLVGSEGTFDEPTLKSILAGSPVLLPATPGPAAHEDFLTLASLHRLLNIRETSRVVRNVLTRLQKEEDEAGITFINQVLAEYFGTSLSEITFDERRDLEIRAPISQDGYSLDIVSSGSGLNQILQLAAVIAWRKPALVLLDEPDAHLHSSVQAQLFGFLSSLVERYSVQVVLCTHSRDLISQCPLDSIIPVDPTRSHLKPLQSLEHLLLEYQRYGEVSNVDLALLYQTKTCLFVEGSTDSKLLPQIAERCGSRLFLGSRQAVPFEFKGVDKLKLIPELVGLFQRLVGAELRWGVLRDADATVPEVLEVYNKQGEDLEAQAFHIWNAYSLENLLLEPNLVLDAIRTRNPQANVTIDDIEAGLRSAAGELDDEASSSYVTRAQRAFRDLELDDSPYEAGAAAATRFLRTLGDSGKRRWYPGKRLFGLFVQWLQENHSVSLRITDLVAKITRERAPQELIEVLDALADAFDVASTSSNSSVPQR